MIYTIFEIPDCKDNIRPTDLLDYKFIGSYNNLALLSKYLKNKYDLTYVNIINTKESIYNNIVLKEKPIDAIIISVSESVAFVNLEHKSFEHSMFDKMRQRIRDEKINMILS